MRIVFFALVASLLFSCKNNNSNVDETLKTNNEETSLTPAQQIAQSTGLSVWDDVEEIQFTFNVNRFGEKIMDRNWTWNVKSGLIKLKSKQKEVVYYRNKKMDSTALNADQAFINDVYWLLPQFKLVWDKGTTLSTPIIKQAPISKDSLNMITILYDNKVGYTPGDAYDLYYDQNNTVREWTYRKENDSLPTMQTTFEDYQSYEGLNIATNHITLDGDTNIYFSDIKVIKSNE